jgi:hypothetical protein
VPLADQRLNHSGPVVTELEATGSVSVYILNHDYRLLTVLGAPLKVDGFGRSRKLTVLGAGTQVNAFALSAISLQGPLEKLTERECMHRHFLSEHAHSSTAL